MAVVTHDTNHQRRERVEAEAVALGRRQRFSILVLRGVPLGRTGSEQTSNRLAF